MTTFDSWEVAVHPPEDYLMHFRTKGSKNGVRRYQNPDGTWTELGLEERRKREGFGESRKERRAQKALARAEKHLARKTARAEAKAARIEKKRQNSLKGMTDEELQKKIARLKMEQEYKELTKSPLIKAGEKIVTGILDYQEKKEQRIIDLNKQKIERDRIHSDIIKSKNLVKQSMYNAKKSKNEYKQAKNKRKAGQKYINKKEYINAKEEWRKGTIRGGIQKKIYNRLVNGKGASDNSNNNNNQNNKKKKKNNNQNNQP